MSARRQRRARDRHERSTLRTIRRVLNLERLRVIDYWKSGESVEAAVAGVVALPWTRALTATWTTAGDTGRRLLIEQLGPVGKARVSWLDYVGARSEMEQVVASRVTGIGQGTRAAIRRIVTEAALSPGAVDIDDVAAQIDALYKRGFKGRAVTIARTEVNAAVSSGQWYAARNDPRNLERLWQTQGDDSVRDTHSQAAGQKVAMEELYNVGGYGLRFPADPQGPAHEVVNCRCWEAYAQVRNR